MPRLSKSKGSKRPGWIYFGIGMAVALAFRRASPADWPAWAEVVFLVSIGVIVFGFLKFLEKDKSSGKKRGR